MSYNDYLAGLRDGIEIGFKAGGKYPLMSWKS
jgi:hypothetical protein